mmetsp:Transcript_66830/g.169490  ORF Transcript_66830/g.169490 Transcript_66830/m.169490 type:complete len:212 (+) Transcript_66830:904-1539(+)
MNSVAAMPKMYKIINAMTDVHNNGLTDCTKPWINIHNSLNSGKSLTTRTMRTSRSARNTIRIRSVPRSRPDGSRIHFGMMPVPKTKKVSAVFGVSKNHTQPKALMRKHHSIKKKPTNMCSRELNTIAAPSSGQEASIPINKQLKMMAMAMPNSNLIELTITNNSWYGFWKVSLALSSISSLIRCCNTAMPVTAKIISNHSGVLISVTMCSF